MIKQKTEILVGIFAILALAALAWLTLKVGAGSLPSGETYLIESRFANAGGLNAGGSVLLSGVTVGTVESVRMDPTDYSAIATLRILSALRLPADTMASIKTSGLIGDKFVALAPGAEEEYLAPGARITLTESAVDLESIIGKIAFGAVDKGKETEDQKPTPSP
jgi:phospholipid/cholesterol/gamma-HCH transport system substrate-binding protein